MTKRAEVLFDEESRREDEEDENPHRLQFFYDSRVSWSKKDAEKKC